ncbi:hypothetical protein JCM9140_3964 [Halalkalibacter wakoensis JCM 9140]|uniref:N-acetyltransferase domain-containing protein n=1 Tax=Halalkalibacter wakoensis JCM 9140 TaxID=1236970 RepID=W4Q8S1_9BACI|nr:hypothetical protein JCM9140_3964 [Halalkalibacter wakoensis JCM 9140]
MEKLMMNFADAHDAAVIHHVMIQAFTEYKDETPPSSALEETVQSVAESLQKGERALMVFEGKEPVGMVRFQVTKEGLYFYRLSVIPEKQGQGIAKKMLYGLEDLVKKEQLSTILCKVRMTVPKNIQLYRSIGYEISDEEIVHKPNGQQVSVVTMKKTNV